MRGIATTGGLIDIGFCAEVICDSSPAGEAGAIIVAAALKAAQRVALVV